MIHSRRTNGLAYWCLPKPEPVHTRLSRGHKTYLKDIRIEEVVKVRWMESKGRN
jgi:hypothetical protein